MKLLTQTNRRYLYISLIALALNTIALLWGVSRLFDHFVDERLVQLQAEVLNYVNIHDSLPVFFQSTSAKLLAQPSAAIQGSSFRDTILFNDIEEEKEPFRRLRFGLQLSGQNYQIDILQSVVETEDIVGLVLLLNLVLILATVFGLFWAQKKLSARLWQPFYATLESLRSFHLTQAGPLLLAKTTTDEFVELNSSLERLTERVRHDYRSLKRFTEDASHEIQTPLAVIRIKLDTLLQSVGLNEGQLTHLHSAQRAAARLSRLQQNLLLLVKIENNQFQVQESISLKQLIANKLELLEDFIVSKNIHISNEGEDFSILLPPFLAETLIGNLISNAVKHNLMEGSIQIQLDKSSLNICNSSTQPEVPPIEFLARFRRGDSQSEGLGLGLAIVKEICDQQGWTLEVRFENGYWISIVHFQSS